MTVARRLDPWVVGLAVVLIAGLPFLLWMGRGLTFFSDEWAFIESRSLGDVSTWLPPHNEHWTTVPILAYRALVETAGIGSYVPFLAVTVVLHGIVIGLVFSVVRRRSGPLLALAIAAPLAFFGSGFENFYWAFQASFTGATAAGLAAFVIADGAGSRRWIGSAVLLTVCLASAGIALAFVVAMFVELLIRRMPREILLTLGPPVAVYGVWFAAFGRHGVTTRPPLSAEALLDVPGSIVTGFGNAAGAISGTGPAIGLAVAAAIAAWAGMVIWRERRLPARFIGCVAGIATLYGLIGLTRAHQFEGIVDYTRYTYVASILLLIGLSDLAGRIELPRPGGGRVAFLAATGSLLAVALAFNIRLLFDGRELFLERAAMTRALVTVGLSRPLPASTDPNRTLVLVPSPAALERIVMAYGSPVGDSIVPGAVEPIPPDVLAEARRRLEEGAEIPR
ncbi:MAG TPA: hypothetical protein VFO78_12575 [Candidatus Limnocylindrales bacterium]|nr:hypothetical protein [Candidatus Limnocylindrales bacterium]